MSTHNEAYTNRPEVLLSHSLTVLGHPHRQNYSHRQGHPYPQGTNSSRHDGHVDGEDEEPELLVSSMSSLDATRLHDQDSSSQESPPSRAATATPSAPAPLPRTRTLPNSWAAPSASSIRDDEAAGVRRHDGSSSGVVPIPLSTTVPTRTLDYTTRNGSGRSEKLQVVVRGGPRFKDQVRSVVSVSNSGHVDSGSGDSRGSGSNSSGRPPLSPTSSNRTRLGSATTSSRPATGRNSSQDSVATIIPIATAILISDESLVDNVPFPSAMGTVGRVYSPNTTQTGSGSSSDNGNHHDRRDRSGSPHSPFTTSHTSDLSMDVQFMENHSTDNDTEAGTEVAVVSSSDRALEQQRESAPPFSNRRANHNGTAEAAAATAASANGKGVKDGNLSRDEKRFWISVIGVAMCLNTILVVGIVVGAMCATGACTGSSSSSNASTPLFPVTKAPQAMQSSPTTAPTPSPSSRSLRPSPTASPMAVFAPPEAVAGPALDNSTTPMYPSTPTNSNMTSAPMDVLLYPTVTPLPIDATVTAAPIDEGLVPTVPPVLTQPADDDYVEPALDDVFADPERGTISPTPAPPARTIATAQPTWLPPPLASDKDDSNRISHGAMAAIALASEALIILVLYVYYRRWKSSRTTDRTHKEMSDTEFDVSRDVENA